MIVDGTTGGEATPPVRRGIIPAGIHGRHTAGRLRNSGMATMCHGMCGNVAFNAFNASFPTLNISSLPISCLTFQIKSIK